MKTTILVIEDDLALLEDIREVLSIYGYEVITASSGDIGLELAKLHTPRVIICESILPEMNEFGVLKAIREDKKTANIIVILLSPKVERPHIRRGMELGADDFLFKPFSVDDLTNCLKIRIRRADQIEEWRNTTFT